jgi:hypothetical protein
MTGADFIPLGDTDKCGVRRATVSMLIHESRVFQVATFNALNLHQSELDPKRLLSDIVVIADEVDAQLMQAVSSLLKGKRLPG